jgi:small subunit ribosomal protein S17
MTDEQHEQGEETPVETEPVTDEVVADETPVEDAAEAPSDDAETEPEPATPAEAEEDPAEIAAEVAEEAEPEATVDETGPDDAAIAEPAPDEPAAEATPEADAAAEPAAAAATARKKKKRVPRAERPQRTKTKRVKAAERKPISRLPKPEHGRGRSQERQGTVVSAAMDKTIVVRVDVAKVHPRYKKVIRRSSKFHAHDERNEAKVGDVVLIVETRPLSRTKRWRLQQIVEAAR